MIKLLIKISDPPIAKEVEVNEEECTTVDNLKQLIANTFHLEISQFSIENLPKSKTLNFNTKDYHIKIRNNCKNIKFRLPNLTTLIINDGYKKKFNEIIQEFKFNQIYFSISAENNLSVNFSDRYYTGKELKKDPYPFLSISPNTIVNVITTNSFVILEYGKRKFYLLDTDTIGVAQDLIFCAFRKETSYESIKITKDDMDEALANDYTLKKKDKYKVHIMTIYKFKNLKIKKNNFRCKMDYLITVYEAREYLYNKYNKNILIFTNKDDRIAADEDESLKNLQDEDGNIYYRISKLEWVPKKKEESQNSEENDKNKSESDSSNESESESDDDDDGDEEDEK